MPDKPVFSVIIPVHNKLPHLERSIQSVIRQSFQNFELILVDDASSDGSSEKLTEFRDSRIKLLKRDVPGPGGYAARNLGIAHSTGEWICFLDADDEWEARVLETIVKFSLGDPDVELISWGWHIVKGSKRTVDKFSNLHKEHSYKYINLIDFLNGPQPIWTGAVSIKKSVLLKAGVFPEKDFKRGGDMDTWIRCLWHSNKSVWLNETMSSYHVDSVNMITKSIERDLLFIFSPFLKELSRKKDNQLNKAIMHFQNRYIYILLNGNVYEGKKIDYKILKRMSLDVQGLWLVLKLHLNKLRLSVKGD